MHDIAPRIVRYTANLQKWLLTQAILTLHFEHKTDATRPGLTAAKLIDFIVANNGASKNTAVAHLAEMRSYRLLLDAEWSGDKRLRPLIVADTAEDLIRQWFDGHLKSLDRLDGGKRHHLSGAEPSLMHFAQPRAIRRLFVEPGWCAPPENVATFVWTESGSNILHDLIARLPKGELAEGPTSVGPLRISEITSRYIISKSHAQRVFARARDLGIVGWQKPGNRGDLWVSSELVCDYRRWQAVKFAALEEAFDWAVAGWLD
ncbi:hypothetical protein [Ensifer sp. Root31]|uniref:hypothetical protein n=1 Tax=Ensifer sp. Root31 TaxID=1736512 RepID=UPI001FCDED7A|nr:hypothetical protein [Ensifer sp. Root31]